MADFITAEDFPKSEIEFNHGLSQPQGCFDYLLNKYGPMVLCAKNVVIGGTG